MRRVASVAATVPGEVAIFLSAIRMVLSGTETVESALATAWG
jgi:hypothetical protein